MFVCLLGLCLSAHSARFVLVSQCAFPLCRQAALNEAEKHKQEDRVPKTLLDGVRVRICVLLPLSVSILCLPHPLCTHAVATDGTNEGRFADAVS